MSEKQERLPNPPVPAWLDLREYPYMPLLAQRLLDSKLTARASDFVFRHSVLSWAIAWHQVPAGSLPDDDDELAWLFRYGSDKTGVARWKKAREKGALYGWFKAADGRLYHAVVCEVAIDTYNKSKTAAKNGRLRAEKAKEIKERGADGLDPGAKPGGEAGGTSGGQQPPGAAGGPSRVLSIEESRGEGRGGEEKRAPAKQGTGEAVSLTPDNVPVLMAMWPAGRCGSEYEVRQWTQRLVGVEVEWPALLEGARAYAASVDNAEGDAEEFFMALPTWLGKRRWTERPPPAKVQWQPPQSENAKQAETRRRMIGRQGRFGTTGHNGAYAWKPTYGAPPTDAELSAARRAWVEHCVAWADGKVRWDEALYGKSKPDHGGDEVARARAIVAMAKGAAGTPAEAAAHG